MWKTATWFCTRKVKRRLELTSKASFSELQICAYLNKLGFIFSRRSKKSFTRISSIRICSRLLDFILSG
ncbi:hypothetical protein QN277_019086 [Acacia crassicarpa]|uniref:Uncharacterized protein n=1 Tax=Acacia crassicarpa TaxID=499986 RepID=A0AAE1MPX9_9FABA|nr:hypothetical protein QN277_019086 [Acacia crassicarpa]